LAYLLWETKYHVCTAEAIPAAELPLMMDTLGGKGRNVQLVAENALEAFHNMSESPQIAFMSGNAGRQRPVIGTFDDGFEGLGPSRKLMLPNAHFPPFSGM
jgi:hypothetical protein